MAIGEPNKTKAKSYDDKFLDLVEKSDLYQNWSKNKNNIKLATTNAFDNETHRVNFDSSNQDYLDEGINPFLNQHINLSAEDPYNEIRASNQGGLDETGKFFGRVGLKVGTEIAKTVGAIGGTALGIAGNTSDLITGRDEHDFLETAFNNDFIKAAENIQKYIQGEYLPVYVSDTVDNGNFLDKVSSGEFWATEGADGVGYLISAMAPGAAFKALGGANKIFGGITKATALRYGKNIEVARKALTNAGLTTSKIDSYMIPAFNTYFEAGAEAKGVGDSIESRKSEFIDKFKSNLDINSKDFQTKALEKAEELDIKLRSGEISIDEYNKLGKQLPEIVANELAESAFLEQKGRAMRNTFLTNVGILAVPNYIQAKLVFGKNPSKVLIDKITGKAADKTIKNTVKQGLKRTGKAFLSEGSEEVGQTSTEHRNANRAINNSLSEYAIQDANLITFGQDFVKSLGTTEGQVAGFLGGVLGSPISIVQGYRQDNADRKNTERLREKINGQSTALQDIYNTPIYETEEYTNPETGETITRDKEVDGKKIFIPENVAKIKKALDLQGVLSEVYDKAIEQGDTETLEALKKQGEFNIITNFIGEDVVTLDALNEHLKVIFPVSEKNEDGSTLSADQVKQNTENKERISNVIDKAKVLQKDLASFKDMSQSIIRLNNPEATETQIADFLNSVGYAFISERSEEYDAKEKLDKLESEKSNILKEIGYNSPGFFYKPTDKTVKKVEKATKQIKEIDVDENGFAFLTGNEIYQNNPRLNYLNEQIKKQKDKLKDFNETTNDLIWNNEYLNQQLDAKIKAEKKIKEEASPENAAKNDKIIQAINTATTIEEVENIEKDDVEKTTSQKEDELTILNNIKQRIIDDGSLENLQNVLEIVKNSNFSNYDVNRVIDSIENSIKKIIDERSQFEEIVFEIAEKYANKNKELSDKLIEIDNRITKLLESKQLLKKSLPNTTKKSKNRVLKRLIRETENELKKVESEIKKLESEKTQLIKNLTSINQNLNYLYSRLEQINKVGFKNIDDIINYLEKNKERFGEHRFDISRLETQQFYVNQNIEGLENVIDYLENYKSVLEQTIKDYLKSDENNSEELYFLQEELNDAIENIEESKKELIQEKDKILRINKALNDKLSKESLNKEIEFWNKLQKFKESKKQTNPIIQQKIEEKKAEIIKVEEIKQAEEVSEAKQEDEDFNNVTAYDGLTATEGSIITDELIPQEAENNTVKELNSIQNSEVDSGLGVKVISTDKNTGLPLTFITEQFPLYLKYEREPVNKSGKEVKFEINQTPGKNPKVLEALNAFNNKDFSNPKLLIDYLPINILFTNEVKAPIETRRTTGDINTATELLRTEIISNLINGVLIENISTTIQDQYKGILKIDENRLANNNILQLDGVKDLNYIRENLFVVNSFGKLQNILTEQTSDFINDKIKPNAAGEIYLMIPQANGKMFPLKLNIKKINENEASILYDIYKEILTNAKSLDTTLSEINEELKQLIEDNFKAELSIIGGNKNDIKLNEIIDLLIYQSDNIKSRMQIDNGVLLFGNKESTVENIEQSKNEIIDFLINQKRHQIKIGPKFETDNTKTNLKSNSADYLKYLVDNNILSTNAVVNEPTFQGYTNIYLNTGITVSNQTKPVETNNVQSDIEAKKAEVTKLEKQKTDLLIQSNNPQKITAKTPSKVSVYLSSANKDGSFNKSSERTSFVEGASILAFEPIANNRFAVYIDTKNPSAVKMALQYPDKRIEPTFEAISAFNPKAKTIQTIKPAIVELQGDKYVLIERGEIDYDNEGIEKINNKNTSVDTSQIDAKISKAQSELDAELKALEQPTVSDAGVEVKTEGTGFENLFGNISTVTQPVTGTSISYTPTGKQTQTYTIDKTRILNSNGEEVFKEDSADRRKIFANLAIKEGRAKVIEDDKGVKYVVNNKQQIMSTITGKIMAWAENHPTRLLLNSKYNNLINPKVSDAGVQVTTTNTGFEDLFENKPNNTRNSQENFVSLSEIPGTPQNTEVKETQKEVFETVKVVNPATEQRLINSLIKKYQEDKLVSERDIAKFEAWKQSNPEQWKKICK
jgi:hypothetical protein